MNYISRTLTGGFLIFAGIFLISLTFFELPLLVGLIYGIPLLILGTFIFLNKKEDKIEQIK